MGFLETWTNEFELRNIMLFTCSIVVFSLIWCFKSAFLTDNTYFRAAFILIEFFCIVISTISAVKLVFKSQTFDKIIYYECLWIFGISVIIAVIIPDINVVVASSTILLVIITAYSIKKTTDIAQRQLKLQNDPVISLTIKENEVNVQVIDLIIENVGNGIARNIQFDVHPHGFITLSGDPIENLYFFQRGIQILSPKQKFVINLVNFAEKIQRIRERDHIPIVDVDLSTSEAQNFRRTVRTESELRFTVHFENNEGQPNCIVFNFNLCIFWGLRFIRRQFR